MKELLLTRSFIWSSVDRRVNPGYLLSALGVLIGVTFLILTLGIYDSYVAKLETITFSVYPHILILDDRRAVDDSSALENESEPLERCDRICSGETILNPQQAFGGSSFGPHASLSRLKDLEQAVDGLADVSRIAPLILQEQDVLCRFEHQGREHIEMKSLRVLGLDFSGQDLVPRVDLFLDAPVRSRLASGENLPVALSKELAQSLFQSTEVTGETLTVRRPGEELILSVVGTFSLGFHSISKNMIITDLRTGQKILGLGDTASYFGIAVTDPYRADQTLHQMTERLSQRSFNASSWIHVASGDFESIRLFRWIIFVVLGISFLITGFTIRNTLTIVTLERRRQIGILRALGLRNGSIRGVFTLIAFLIAFSGSFLGMALGLFLNMNFGRWLNRQFAALLPISDVHVTIQPQTLVQVFCLVIFACLITALLSVRQALELDPVACLEAE